MDTAGWRGVELRHLAALAAVAREGSFRGAADSLGYVQSAVSEQVARLERTVGVRLVERRRGAAAVALTPPGEVLLKHFEDVLAQLTAAKTDLDALQDGRAGRLRIGVYESVATRILPRAFAAFGRAFPDIKLEPVEGRSSAALAGPVKNGDIDVAFGQLPLPPGPFAYREVLRDPYALIVPAHWPLARSRDTPTVEQLSQLGLIVDSGHWGGIEQRLRAHGVEPRVALRSDLNTAVQALVAAGAGAAVLPRLAINEADDSTVALDLGDVLPPRIITVYWHANRCVPEALENLIATIARVSAEVATSVRVPALAA